MNISWTLCGLTALVTGIGRSFVYFESLEPLLSSSAVPIQSWFTTVWFLVSGLFLFAALAFLAIGIRPLKFASKQIASLLTMLFAIVWITILFLNLGVVESSTTQPLYPVGAIVLLGGFGIFREGSLDENDA
jgi:hypothetical protein